MVWSDVQTLFAYLLNRASRFCAPLGYGIWIWWGQEEGIDGSSCCPPLFGMKYSRHNFLGCFVSCFVYLGRCPLLLLASSRLLRLALVDPFINNLVSELLVAPPPQKSPLIITHGLTLAKISSLCAPDLEQTRIATLLFGLKQDECFI